MDPMFRVEVLSRTENPQTLCWWAMHQDYSEGFVFDQQMPSEVEAGQIVGRYLLAGGRGHFGPLEHPAITFNVGWFPHSVMQQARTHRVGLSFDVQCVAGDTKLLVLKEDGGIASKRTIAQLHQLWQDDPDAVRRLRIRSLDEERNCYTANHIDAVISSGIKPVFLVTLADGKTIRCTKEHRILSVNGWRELGDLAVGDKVMVNGRATADAPTTYQNKEWLQERFERGITPKEIAMEAGVSVEAIKKWAYHYGLTWTHRQWNKGIRYRLNISDAERARRRQHAATVLAAIPKPQGPKHAAWKADLAPEVRAYNWLKYARPQLLKAVDYRCVDCGDRHPKLHCHHVLPVEARPDLGCEASNIRVLCPRCHKRTHALAAHPVRIIAIEPAGECATYDIAMQAPHHNFVADGIVVHNSMRYTGQRIVWAAQANTRSAMEHVFYLRPVGHYTDRQGKSYEYTEKEREADLDLCASCAWRYRQMINAGFAEEHARGVIPFDVRQHFVVSFNLRSVLHFMDLRAKKDAQDEIRQLCELMWPHVERWAPAVAEWYGSQRMGKARLAP
jgi:thymidylate synthase (FAD)